MLTSGSSASASSAAFVMEAMLRSASARRRFGADAVVVVFGIDSVDGHRLRVELQLREEVPRVWENRKCHQARERSDRGGDEEGVADTGGRLRADDRSARPGGDRRE